MSFTHASLFSGIGGFDLAAEWVGWKNVFHCEINEFCAQILKYHFPNAYHYEDIKTTDFTKWRGKINVLSGGFPCQPFSLAWRRKGAEDDRYLWPQMLRAIQEIKPDWVVGENVAGIISMVQPGKAVELGRSATLFGEDYKDEEIQQQYVIETMCQDLEHSGYSIQPILIPACAVDAPHRRDRCAIIGCRALERKHNGRGRRTYSLENSDCFRFSEQGVLSQQPGRTKLERDGKDVAYPESIGLQRERPAREQIGGARPEKAQPEGRCDVLSDTDHGSRSMWRNRELSAVEEAGGVWTDHGGRTTEYVTGEWWPAEPGVCRVVDGVPNRVDRLKCLGNAVAPPQFYPVFQAIADIERGIVHG